MYVILNVKSLTETGEELKIKTNDNKNIVLNKKDYELVGHDVNSMVMADGNVGFIKEIKIKENGVEYYVAFNDGTDGRFSKDEVKRV